MEQLAQAFGTNSDNMAVDLAIGVAVGSSMQIALLVLPLSVVIGWIVGAAKGPAYEPMTLNFDGFVIAVLFVSVLLVNYLISDGKSHWLEGVMLMTTYIVCPRFAPRLEVFVDPSPRSSQLRRGFTPKVKTWRVKALAQPHL